MHLRCARLASPSVVPSLSSGALQPRCLAAVYRPVPPRPLTQRRRSVLRLSAVWARYYTRNSSRPQARDGYTLSTLQAANVFAYLTMIVINMMSSPAGHRALGMQYPGINRMVRARRAASARCGTHS